MSGIQTAARRNWTAARRRSGQPIQVAFNEDVRPKTPLAAVVHSSRRAVRDAERQEDRRMKNQNLKARKQEVQAQCAFPTFMEIVLDTVERVLRNNAKNN